MRSEEDQMGGWGCLPVIRRDGDQRLEAALKVDLCRKSRSQAKGAGHPASSGSPPDSPPLPQVPLGSLSSFSCSFQEIPTARRLSPAGPRPPAHPHALSPSPVPLCPLTPPGLNLMFFNLIDLDLETQTELQKSNVGPSGTRLPDHPSNQPRWVPSGLPAHSSPGGTCNSGAAPG